MAKVKIQELDGEAVAELIPLSSERRALAKLASQGGLEWQLMSETILRDRR